MIAKFDRNMLFPEFYGSFIGNVGILMWIARLFLKKDAWIEIPSSLAQVSPLSYILELL